MHRRNFKILLFILKVNLNCAYTGVVRNCTATHADKMKNTIKAISIISYFLVILGGQMIGLPLVVWLIFTIFDFGNIDQLFSILAIIGIMLNFSKWRNSIPVMVLSFIVMLSPIISRMVQVPIEMFNYLAFQIPLTIFIITYFIFILINAREKLRTTS